MLHFVCMCFSGRVERGGRLPPFLFFLLLKFLLLKIKITLLWGCAFFMVIPCASMGEATLARQGMAEGK
jgi:hypothetical protein